MNTLKNIITDFGTKPFRDWEAEHGPKIAGFAIVGIVVYLFIHG